MLNEHTTKTNAYGPLGFVLKFHLICAKKTHMKIYQFESYVEFLRESIGTLKRPGIMTELARTAGCNRTYLSQVLAGKAHLTADHVLNLAEVFRLDEDEADFFLLLLLKERSANRAARQKLEVRIQRLLDKKIKHEYKMDPAFKIKKMSQADLLHHCSDWRYQAATTLTHLPHTQTLSALSERLGLSVAETAKILETLIEWQLVEKKGARYVHAGRSLLPLMNGPIGVFHHTSWRMRAMDQIRRGGGLHMSLNITVSSRDALILKTKLLALIDEHRKVAYHSKPLEEAHVFCCDLFRLD